MKQRNTHPGLTMRGMASVLQRGALTGLLLLTAGSARGDDPGDRGMPTRPLGKTGFAVTVFGLGGQATIERRGQDELAHEIINRALDHGVNYIDTAPSYGNGVSERYIGRVMKDRRDEVFLATKSHDYSYDGTMRLVRQSLERLQTDTIDLYQHHNVGRDRDLERILADDGALRAFRELREQNVVRFIGISSHSPRILLKALELDVYDCMLITLNPAGTYMNDRGYLDEFLAKAREKNVGVIAMKVIGRRALLRDGVTASELVSYALSFQVDTAIVGISETWMVDENVETARAFKPMSPQEKRTLENRF